MNPGTVGIEVDTDGQITGFTEEPLQQALVDAGVNKNWKLVKIDSEKYTKQLLKEKADGSENYKMEFVYTGGRPDVKKGNLVENSIFGAVQKALGSDVKNEKGVQEMK